MGASGVVQLFSVSPKVPRAGDGPVTLKLVTPNLHEGRDVPPSVTATMIMPATMKAMTTRSSYGYDGCN